MSRFSAVMRQAALLLGLLGSLLTQIAQSDDAVSELVLQLRQGSVAESALQGQGMQSADGLFLLGWLYDQGSYGVDRDMERARELLQQAAELGQFDAMHYCWGRCLTLTPEVLEQLRQGVGKSQPQALYLQSLLVASGLAVSEEAVYLSAAALQLQAARQGSLDAMNRLYTEHFVNWAAQGHTLNEAKGKLQYCIDDGVEACFYLLGALHEQHNDHQQALFYYQVLALVDPARYQRYLSTEKIAELLSRAATPSIDVVRARAASYLAQRSPTTGSDQIDRFSYCRDAIGYRCASRLARTDSRCMLSDFSSTYLRGFRDSAGYSRCLNATGSR